MSLQDAKRGVSDSFVAQNRSGLTSVRRLKITARTAGASKTIEAEVDKPLGLTLGQKPGGGVLITVSLPHSTYIFNLQLHILLSTNEKQEEIGILFVSYAIKDCFYSLLCLMQFLFTKKGLFLLIFLSQILTFNFMFSQSPSFTGRLGPLLTVKVSRLALLSNQLVLRMHEWLSKQHFQTIKICFISNETLR